MSVDDIKEEIKNLSEEERGEVMSFLAQLRITDDPDYWERIRRRMDDKNPDHWVSDEEVRQRIEEAESDPSVMLTMEEFTRGVQRGGS